MTISLVAQDPEYELQYAITSQISEINSALLESRPRATTGARTTHDDDVDRDFLAALEVLRQDLEEARQIRADDQFAHAVEPVIHPTAAPSTTVRVNRVNVTVDDEDQALAEMLAEGVPQVFLAPALEPTILSLKPTRPRPSSTPTEATPKENNKKEDLHVPDTCDATISRSKSPVPSINLIPILATTIGWEMPDDTPAVTSSTRAAGDIYPAEEIMACDICGSDVKSYRAIPLSCGHVHCTDCLRENHLLVVRRSSAYPPRCCSSIPLSIAADVLTARELSAFLQQHFEHESGGTKFACSNRNCNKMILSPCIRDDVGFCLSCSTFTCGFCKKESHDGTVCQEDKDTTQLLETAKKEGWSDCYKCHSIVERTQGCYHMTCRCGGQFCYLCFAKWKSCQCPSFEETDLLGQTTGRAKKAIQLTAKTLSALARSQYRAVAERARDEQEEVEDSLQRMRAEKEDVRHVADQIVLLRSEEWAERNEMVEKAKQERAEKQVKKDRRLFLSRLFLLKLEAANDRVVKNAKGKGKRDQGQFDNITQKLVEYATLGDDPTEQKVLKETQMGKIEEKEENGEVPLEKEDKDKAQSAEEGKANAKEDKKDKGKAVVVEQETEVKEEKATQPEKAKTLNELMGERRKAVEEKLKESNEKEKEKEQEKEKNRMKLKGRNLLLSRNNSSASSSKSST